MTVFSEALGPDSQMDFTSRTVLFLGSKDFGLNVFKCLYSLSPKLNWTVCHPDDTKDERSVLGDFADFAKSHDIEMRTVRSPSESRELVIELCPDVIFVCGWYWLLEKVEILTPRLGVWGIHNSLLPKYRGGSPLVWAIINGDEIVGSSLFRFTEGMDDGPILFQVNLSIGNNDHIEEITANLNELVVKCLPRYWREIVNGSQIEIPQNHEEATYCGLRTEADGRIDWSQDASYIHNFIRAQSYPYPCAFTELDGEILKIHTSRVFHKTFLGTPGQVLSRSDNAVLVSCGHSTAIFIEKVEFNGLVQWANEAIGSIQKRLH
jgi:methionyl-tRNA formyltransferase